MFIRVVRNRSSYFALASHVSHGVYGALKYVWLAIALLGEHQIEDETAGICTFACAQAIELFKLTNRERTQSGGYRLRVG